MASQEFSELLENLDYSTEEMRNGKWSAEEDHNLNKYAKFYKNKPWRKIAEHMPGRSSIECLHRWTKVIKPGLVKGPWSKEEDQKLIAWIEREGPTRWSQAATFIKGRSGKQCRERWFNNLCPGVKKGSWSEEEDEMIFQLYQKYGSSWSKISKYIPGRTENAIKNRFYSTLRKTTTDKKKIFLECDSNALKRELSDNLSAELNDDLRVLPSVQPKDLGAHQPADKNEMIFKKTSSSEIPNHATRDQEGEKDEKRKQNYPKIDQLNNEKSTADKFKELDSQFGPVAAVSVKESQKLICSLPKKVPQQNETLKDDTPANIHLLSTRLMKFLEDEKKFENVLIEPSGCEMNSKTAKEDNELEKFLMKLDCKDFGKGLVQNTESQPFQKTVLKDFDLEIIKKRISEFSRNNIMAGALTYRSFSNFELLLKGSISASFSLQSESQKINSSKHSSNEKVGKSPQKIGRKKLSADIAQRTMSSVHSRDNIGKLANQNLAHVKNLKVVITPRNGDSDSHSAVDEEPSNESFILGSANNCSRLTRKDRNSLLNNLEPKGTKPCLGGNSLNRSTKQSLISSVFLPDNYNSPLITSVQKSQDQPMKLMQTQTRGAVELEGQNSFADELILNLGARNIPTAKLKGESNSSGDNISEQQRIHLTQRTKPQFFHIYESGSNQNAIEDEKFASVFQKLNSLEQLLDSTRRELNRLEEVPKRFRSVSLRRQEVYSFVQRPFRIASFLGERRR